MINEPLSYYLYKRRDLINKAPQKHGGVAEKGSVEQGAHSILQYSIEENLAMHSDDD
jgi:hypothetical protein